jgi:hypothetical protein
MNGADERRRRTAQINDSDTLIAVNRGMYAPVVCAVSLRRSSTPS